MALIECPDCKKEISNNAISCVYCGYRQIKSVFIQELGFDGEVFKVIVCIGLLVAIVGIFTQNILIISGGIGLMLWGTLLLLIRSLK